MEYVKVFMSIEEKIFFRMIFNESYTVLNDYYSNDSLFPLDITNHMNVKNIFL